MDWEVYIYTHLFLYGAKFILPCFTILNHYPLRTHTGLMMIMMILMMMMTELNKRRRMCNVTIMPPVLFAGIYICLCNDMTWKKKRAD